MLTELTVCILSSSYLRANCRLQCCRMRRRSHCVWTQRRKRWRSPADDTSSLSADW